MPAEFRPLGERIIHRGPVFEVAVGEVRTPEGDVVTREYVRHPGAVMVVPVVGGEAVLVRQYRAAIDEHLLEIPAGKRDVAGEQPEVTAARELQEEVGLRAGRLELLSTFYNTPGFSDEHSYCYLGLDCAEVSADRQGVEERHMSIERLGLDAVPGAIADGRLIDAKSIIGLLLARERLGVR